MTKTLIASLFLALCLTTQSLFALELKPDAPMRYTVKKGDTLWDISERFVGSPWEWLQIWHRNPHIENPDLIYPGDVIGLIQDGSQTKLAVITRSEEDVELKDPVQSIPDKALSRAATNYHFFTEQEIQESAYVIASSDERLLMSTGDTIYVKGDLPEGEPLYHIYRIGDKYVDGDSEELLGIEALKIASGRLKDRDEDLITLEIIAASHEVQKGDRILAVSPQVERNVTPKKAPEDIEGHIVGSPKKVNFLGQYDLVAINLGTADGVVEGSVLMVEKVGRVVKDEEGENVQLPNQKAGVLMVYKTSEEMSYALILKANLSIKLGDKVSTPN